MVTPAQHEPARCETRRKAPGAAAPPAATPATDAAARGASAATPELHELVRCVARYEKADLASVHVLELSRGPDRLVEAVESVQPPIAREDKWVLIVSTHVHCPVGCAMCDAGGDPRRLGASGALGTREMLAQIDHLVATRYPDRRLPQRKLKVQFARMGEPALNPSVLEVLRELPAHLDAPGLLPCVSSVAPVGRDAFFRELAEIKDALYSSGRFQMQLSVHTTDEAARRLLIPIRCWDLRAIGRFGEQFHAPGDRKIGLNFAACDGFPIEAARVAEHCDPTRFVVKLTPLNPTSRVRRAGLRSWIDGARPDSAGPLAESFAREGFDVIVSIGELEENAIGSNCGQLVTELRDGAHRIREGYRSAAYGTAAADHSGT